MITREYRKTDEYKALYEAVQRACPGIPDIIAEQAIFLHKRDPMLYKKILKEERDQKRRQTEEAARNKKAGGIISSTDDDGSRVPTVPDERIGHPE